MSETGKGSHGAIIDAFNRLVLRTRKTRPPVAQLLHEANVARSTFYEHFDSRDSALVEAMRGPLSLLAESIVRDADAGRLTGLLNHFWEQRSGARDLMNGPLAPRLVRALADLIEARAERLDRADALRVADAQIGMVRLWVNGETPCSAQRLAEKMIALGGAQWSALSQSAPDKA